MHAVANRDKISPATLRLWQGLALDDAAERRVLQIVDRRSSFPKGCTSVPLL